MVLSSAGTQMCLDSRFHEACEVWDILDNVYLRSDYLVSCGELSKHQNQAVATAAPFHILQNPGQPLMPHVQR